MKIERVAVFVDGFNLYHAIDRLQKPHLKWLNLWALSKALIYPKTQRLVNVFYFSAFAEWIPDRCKRHKEYIKALKVCGITPILGKFKNKDRKCPKCKYEWLGHEEKETDVNIALYLLNEAYKDSYDHAFLISRDSDLAPAINLVKSTFPEKIVTVVAPPFYNHSFELMHAAHSKAKININQLERSLLPEKVFDSEGHLAASRPSVYEPSLCLAVKS